MRCPARRTRPRPSPPLTEEKERRRPSRKRRPMQRPTRPARPTPPPAASLIMDQLRKALDERGNARNSVLHNCGVGTHAVLNAGTTNDAFLRDHLDWMKKASNWYVGRRPGLVMLAVYIYMV